MDVSTKLSDEKICICGQLPDYIEEILKQKALEETNKLKQSIVKIPENIIKNLQEAEYILLKIIYSFEDPTMPEFDPDKVIAELQKLLDPVVNTLLEILDSVGLPEIPGLKEIKDLLDVLSNMKKMEKPEWWKGDWPKKGKMPEFPPELRRALTELVTAIQTLCTTLPMVMTNILFNTVDKILGVQIPVVGLSFYDILGQIPFIKEIPALVKLSPKIVVLVTNAPGKIETAVTGKIMQQLKTIQDLQIPDVPDDIKIYPPVECPIHGKITNS